tara:strand:+ start:614 stop:865 length:252 start_codon:yes stop_codon:yes gene_type:complete
MKVKDYLPKLKANRYTYYNLNQKTIQDFKNLYNYLKKHGDKEIGLLFGIIVQLNKYKEKLKETDYIKKYTIMSLLSQTIKHEQ